MSRAVRLAREVQEMFKQAELENRSLTADERAYAQERLDEAEQVGAMEKQIHQVGRAIGAPGLGNPFAESSAPMSPGEMFTSSPAYKSLFGEAGARGEQWTTGPVELPAPWQTKGTLLEGLGVPGSGSGGGLVAAPQVVPGVVVGLFQPLTIEALLSSNVATGPVVRYVVEGTATSGAGGVAEGGSKPESTLGLGTRDEQVKKIATLLPVSEEIMEDAPAIQNFLNQRLSLFVQIETERELLRGASGGNEVQGLLTSRNVPVYNGGTADNKAVQLFKAMNSMRGSALIEPEWTILHPADYQIVRLLTDSAGQLFGGGPFIGPYGGPQGPVDSSGQVSGAIDQLWGKPCYITASVGGPGTAIVGTSMNACVWSRGGLRVEASNQHSNFFQLNLIALRAERRLALAVYRPSGFVETRFAVGPGG